MIMVHGLQAKIYSEQILDDPNLSSLCDAIKYNTFSYLCCHYKPITLQLIHC